MVDVVCAGCERTFEAKTRRAKWCSAACKMRKRRKPGAPEPADRPDQPAAADDPVNDGLVAAVRQQLEAADRLNTVAGQLAVQLAWKLISVDATGVSGLSKELRAVLAEALEGTPATGGGDAGDEDGALPDEVTAARRKRDAAREAAGRA